VNSKEASSTDLELTPGKTVTLILEISSRTIEKRWEQCATRMVTSTRENGEMESKTERAFSGMHQAESMTEDGRMTTRMAWEP
jgi:hypothetical protein